jgi:hypothetical protein
LIRGQKKWTVVVEERTMMINNNSGKQGNDPIFDISEFRIFEASGYRQIPFLIGRERFGGQELQPQNTLTDLISQNNPKESKFILIISKKFV